MIDFISYEMGAKPNKHTLAPNETYYNAKDKKYYTIGKFGELIDILPNLLPTNNTFTGLNTFSQKVITPRIENSSGEGVNVVGLDKIEDTGKNICTAWGEILANASISDSYNIATVVNDSAGNYTVTFSTAMANADYAVSSSIHRIGINNVACGILTKSTTGFTYWTSSLSNTLANYGFHFTIHGGLN